MSKLQKFPVLSKEELVNSPSRADGVPEAMEYRRRKLAALHMKDVAHEFGMSVTTWAIATTFFNRFYARKSMKRNNPFIVACACLYLAGKLNQEPRSHSKLANELLKAWFGKDHPQLHMLAAAHAAAAKQQQRRGLPVAPPGPALDFFTNMWEAVLEAERALLHTVGFDFNVDIIHTYVARLCNRPLFKALGLNTHRPFQQKLVEISNDIYWKDGLLPLQYPPDKIAIAIFYTIFKAAKVNKVSGLPLPAPVGASGQPWYVEEGLSDAECVEITTRLADAFLNSNKGKKAGEKRKAAAAMGPAGQAPAPSPSAAGTTGAASSTAMLGACLSAAYSGGGPTLGTLGTAADAGGLSNLGSGDGLGEHTSVPRPVSSDIGTTGTMAMPTKRAADGAGSPAIAAAAEPSASAAAVHGLCSKRARQAGHSTAAPTQAASSMGAGARWLPGRHPAHSPLSAEQSTFAPGSDPSLTYPPADPGSAAAAPVGATPPPAAASTPAATADSDKEEGELEEGEVV